jgi:hypothetical protein
MKEILVVANRTLGGRKLMDRMHEMAAGGDVRFRLVVPAQKPSSGLLVYDDVVRDAAQVRVDLALSYIHADGFEATGEVGDGDPFYAVMDAVAEHRPDSIIVSTHPATSSGWLRRDLIERIEAASGLPVEHVVVDLEGEGRPFKNTLVVANKTSGGDELIGRLREKAAGEERHVFILVMPQPHTGGRAAMEARGRLYAVLDRLHDAGLLAAGMIGDPDPYVAAVTALELFTFDDVVISTLPAERSGWLRSDLIDRLKSASPVPVEHVVVPDNAAEAA